MLFTGTQLTGIEIGTGYDLNYQAVLDYATVQGYTLPTLAVQAKQNALIIALKGYGIWNKIDLLYVFATDGDSDFATINWKSPTKFQITKINSPGFTTKVGFNGDGSSSYLNTGFNYILSGVNYQVNSAARIIWVFTAATTGLVLEGSTGNRMQRVNTTSQNINGTSVLSAAITFAGTGYRAINRSSSTNIEGYVDTTQSTATSTSFGTGAAALILSNGASYSNTTTSMFSETASLSQTEHGNYRSAFLTYITGL